MKISNPYAISLPGYQGIFTGRGQGKKCKNNGCPQVTEETFPERLLNEGVLKKDEMFLVSSWEPILRALESKPGTLHLNVNQMPMVDPTDPTREVPELKRLNEQQVADRSPWKSRYDKYTGEYGMWLLKNKKPRFLYISLINSDEYGHLKDYDSYAKTLRWYDEYIKNLVETVRSMGRYGEKTAIMITTDHGRGRWFLWTDQSREYFSAKRICNAVQGPTLEHPRLDFSDPRNRKKTTHADIRPTIETYFGLKPLTGNGYGKSLFPATAKHIEDIKQ
jgi:membrane-anchored protein YejM (alkaline phosphatase superfamily)